MALALFYHPFSSYCWKAMIPLYEAGTAFERRQVDDPTTASEWQARWPLARMPLLVDGAAVVPEASIIIEYLDRHHPGAEPMLPADPELRLEARLLDRFFDNYVHAPTQALVSDRARDPANRDAKSADAAHATLDTALGWLDARMAGRTWAVGDGFTMADCAAAPCLFYADWVHPFREAFPNVAAYRARLLARASVARLIEEARPHRGLFPGGAPDRD